MWAGKRAESSAASVAWWLFILLLIYTDCETSDNLDRIIDTVAGSAKLLVPCCGYLMRAAVFAAGGRRMAIN